MIQYSANDKNATSTMIQLKNVTSMNSFNVITFKIHENAILELNHIMSVLPELSFGPLNPTAVQICTINP